MPFTSVTIRPPSEAEYPTLVGYCCDNEFNRVRPCLTPYTHSLFVSRLLSL